MFQNLLNHFRIFNAGYDLYLATALLTLLNLDSERRPVKTRFSRCAHPNAARSRIGLVPRLILRL